MKPNPLDDRTADRLLSGAAMPDGAPAGYQRVAELFSAARPQPAAMATAQEAATVAALRAAILQHPLPAGAAPRKNVLAKLLTAKAAAVAAALVLTAGTAAAATGSLPDSAQDAASTALAKVGVSVPNSHGQSNAHKGGHGGSDSNGDSSTTESTNKPGTNTPTTSAGPNSHADFGLCNADAKNGDHSNATVFPSHSTCTTVTHPGNAADSNGKPGDATPSTTASTSVNNGKSQKPDTAGPPSSVPGQGATKSSSTDHGNATTTTTVQESSGDTTTTTARANGNDNGVTNGNGTTNGSGKGLSKP